MVRLLSYIRPQVFTVPNVFVKQESGPLDVGTVTLPLSGSASLDYTWTLPRTLRKGYIMSVGFSFSRTGSWLNKLWKGSVEIKWLSYIPADATYPDALFISEPLELRDGGPLTITYGLRLYGRGQSSMDLRFTFSYNYHTGSAPHNCAISIGYAIWQPQTFTNWVP